MIQLVELFEKNIRTNDRQSSKGNQLKWQGDNGIWYKADYTGYEGLTEYIISEFLGNSTLAVDEFVFYKTEEIQYKHQRYLGCASKDFLPKGWKLITLERLFQNYYGKSLHQLIYSMQGVPERIQFVVEQTIRITDLKEFGEYMSKLLTIDAIFLNEDRHTHNIAVLMDEKENFQYCPIFDNGAALLSDTSQDYPLGIETRKLMSEVKPAIISSEFDEILDAVEQLYGSHINFKFSAEDIEKILKKENYYSTEIKSRVYDILTKQIKKYSYLFM